MTDKQLVIEAYIIEERSFRDVPERALDSVAVLSEIVDQNLY